MQDPSVGTVRLLVQWPGPDDDIADGLARAVSLSLGEVDEVGRPWSVEPLFPGSGSDALARCWVVDGAAPAVPTYDPSRVAYDLAALLLQALPAPGAGEPAAEVEPDLPSTSYGVDGVPGGVDGWPVPPGADDPAWSLNAVRAPQAWEVPAPPGGRARGKGVLVASVDTGYTDHPELAGELALQLDRDVLDDDDDARDPLQRRPLMLLDTPGHGTATASVVASRVAGQVTGSAPEATVVPIRAIRSVVQVLDSHVARAVRVAHERGCQVITMSLGGRGFFGLKAAIREAVLDGVIVMAAAGNLVGVVVAPAVYGDCLAVAATSPANEPWWGSSRGREVDISAPGQGVWAAGVDSLARPPRFLDGPHTGTSFSVATLAGVAALWIAHHGHDRIVARYGRSNVQAAFLALLRSRGHWVPPGWVEHGWAARFGPGIVDAQGLLLAGLPELPEQSELSAARSDVPGGGSQDGVARLHGVLADLEPEQVRSVVGDLLRVGAAGVDALPPLAVSELTYRIGEDVQLRSALVTAASPAETAASSASMQDARRLLDRTASRHLAALMTRRPGSEPVAAP